MTPEAQADFNAVIELQEAVAAAPTPERHDRAERMRLDVEREHGIEISGIHPDAAGSADPGLHARRDRRHDETFGDSLTRVFRHTSRRRSAPPRDARARSSRGAAPARRSGSRRTTGAAVSSSDDPGGDPEPGEAGPHIASDGGKI